MRLILCGSAGMAAALALCGSARAQKTLVFPLTSGNTQLQMQVVDTTQSVVPIAQPQIFNNQFSLANILPKLSPMQSTKTKFGYSQFPSADGLPGRGYLSAFGFSRAQAIK